VKLIIRAAALVRRAYWFVFRPKTRGVKCLVEHDGSWLLIRNTYGRSRWTLPGGAVKRNEQPLDAARREVMEEVGIRLDALRYVGSYRSRKDHKQDTVYCFASSTPQVAFRVDGREVAEARWVSPSDLPEPHSRSIDRIGYMLTSGGSGI
jgi:8-oxo-dGTP pyrophosphatase MutT (NUDIX family)